MTLKKTVGLCLLIPMFSYAQDTTRLKEVYVKENRLQIPFSKDNRNIEIITAETIQKLPVRSLNEVLTFLNGVDLRQRGPFGSQADLSIDGGSFDQSLVLVNGVKVSDPQTGHHSLNLPIPLDAIERIEVLRGAASRIYGVNALTGAINIITKSADHTSLSAHLYGGSSFKKREEEDKDGVYYHSGVQVGGSWAKNNLRQQAYYNKEKSNGQRYNTASENDKVFYQGDLELNSSNSLEWLGSYMHNSFGANGFYAAPGDKESEEIVETIFASVASKHQLTDRFYISPRISNRYNEDDYRYFKHDLSKARSIHYNNAFSAGVNARYSTDFGDFGLGLESRFENLNSSNMGEHDRNNQGAYAEFRTDRIKNVSVNVGTYVNYNTQYGWQVYPGMDIGYSLNPYWKLVFNAGSSQRIPSFTDLYLNQRPGNIGNPDLRSENAWQLEGAVKYNRAKLSAHAGYFYRNIDNFIDWIRASADVPYQPFNSGENKINGFNGNIDYRLSSGATSFLLNMGYTYLDPSIKQEAGFTSKYALENLNHQAKFIAAAYRDSWNISVANRFNQRISDKSYFLTDVRLSYSFSDFSVYTDMQNLFDVTYIESSAIPMPGRWFSLGMKVSIE